MTNPQFATVDHDRWQVGALPPSNPNDAMFTDYNNAVRFAEVLAGGSSDPFPMVGVWLLRPSFAPELVMAIIDGDTLVKE